MDMKGYPEGKMKIVPGCENEGSGVSLGKDPLLLDRGLSTRVSSAHLPAHLGPVHTPWLRRQPQHGGGTVSPPHV